MDNGRACGWVDRIINMPQRFRDDRGVGCANGKNDVLRTDGQLVAGYFYAVRAIFQVLHPLGRTRDKGVRKRLGELVAKIVEKFSSRKFEQSRPHHVVQILDCLSRQVDIVQLVLPPLLPRKLGNGSIAVVVRRGPRRRPEKLNPQRLEAALPSAEPRPGGVHYADGHLLSSTLLSNPNRLVPLPPQLLRVGQDTIRVVQSTQH